MEKINGDKDVPFVQAMLKNAGVAVERVEGIDIIRNYTEQSRIFSFRNLVLKSESSRHQPNHILQFIIVVEATLVYGIASDEVLLQYAVSPFSESNTIPAFHSIAHRNNHIKIIVIYFLHLDITLFSAIFLGCRKFCDYRLSFQFIQ